MSDIDRMRAMVQRVIRPPVAGRLASVDGLNAQDNDGYRSQFWTLFAGESVRGMKFFHPYGLISSPKPGMEALGIPVGGRTANMVIVAVNDNLYRVPLNPGEVALYTDEGDTIVLKRGKIIAITSGNDIELVATSKIKATVGNASVEIDPDQVTVVADQKIKLTNSNASIEMDTDEIKIIADNAELDLKSGDAKLTVGSVSIEASAAQVTITAPEVFINSALIDLGGVTWGTHEHADPQGGDTGGPHN